MTVVTAVAEKLVAPRRNKVQDMSLLSVAEVAETLGASKNTVISLIEAGAFDGAHKGCNGKRNSPWRIPRRSLVRFLERKGL